MSNGDYYQCLYMSNGDYYQCLYIFPLIFTHDITEILLKVALNTINHLRFLLQCEIALRNPFSQKQMNDSIYIYIIKQTSNYLS